jgi:hypothetical protein
VDTTERRRTGRRPARDNRARLEWAERSDFRDTTARLTDISQGGASFVADDPPPLGVAVWVRLETPKLTGWISAKVVRLGGSSGGGLAFSGYCPHDFIGGLT